MRKLAAQINKAMKDLANRSNNTLDKDLSAEEYEVVMHG
jgi:hypothetical protein